MNKTKSIAVLTVIALALVFGCKNATNNEAGGTSSEKPVPQEPPVVIYGIGDLILSDGSFLPYDEARVDFNDIAEGVKPVAVIFRGGEKGTALGVGLKQAESLAWAKSGTTGYTTTFEEIVCTPKKGDGYSWGIWDDTKYWDGDTDGSDNWQKICAVDTTDTLDPATNYPAFNFALNYTTLGDTNLATTDYENDWFIPSIAELVEIKQNSSTIYSVFSDLGSGNADIFMPTIYKSSSEYAFDVQKAMSLDFSTTRIETEYKIQARRVCVIHKF